MSADFTTPLHQAESLLLTGDAAGAWRAARRAVRHAPKLPAARIVLGQALFGIGRTEQGIAALTEAARLAGDAADPWYRIGQACGGIGRGEAAAVAFRRAHDADPLHEGAVVALAQRLRSDGDEDAGEAMLRSLLAARPDAARTRLELAAWLAQEDRAQDALDLLDAAKAPPDLAVAWQIRRAHALVRLGHTADARGLIEKIDAPPAGMALPYHHARLRLARGDDAEAAADSMAAALDDHAEDADFRIAAHFHLGRFWLKRDQPDRAFDFWTRGHAMMQHQQPFSRPDNLRFIETSIATLNHTRMTAGPRATNADSTPVFVVGMPRSGTTLMEQILASHAQVFGAGERRALSQAFHRLGGSATTEAGCVANLAGLSAASLDEAAGTYLAELHRLAPDKERIVDKMPGNSRLLGTVALLMPKARIIHCVRDPRDIGFSIFSLRFRGNHPYAHDLADLGWYMGQHHRLMEHWRNALPNPILRIHLSEWIHQFDRTLARVLDFLGLPHDDNCTRFFELDRKVRTASRYQVTQPVNADGMSRWRPYARQLEPLIQELIAAGAI